MQTFTNTFTFIVANPSNPHETQTVTQAEDQTRKPEVRGSSATCCAYRSMLVLEFNKYMEDITKTVWNPFKPNLFVFPSL